MYYHESTSLINERYIWCPSMDNYSLLLKKKIQKYSYLQVNYNSTCERCPLAWELDEVEERVVWPCGGQRLSQIRCWWALPTVHDAHSSADHRTLTPTAPTLGHYTTLPTQLPLIPIITFPYHAPVAAWHNSKYNPTSTILDIFQYKVKKKDIYFSYFTGTVFVKYIIPASGVSNASHRV